jgi:hypothetical protein
LDQLGSLVGAPDPWENFFRSCNVPLLQRGPQTRKETKVNGDVGGSGKIFLLSGTAIIAAIAELLVVF